MEKSSAVAIFDLSKYLDYPQTVTVGLLIDDPKHQQKTHANLSSRTSFFLAKIPCTFKSHTKASKSWSWALDSPPVTRTLLKKPKKPTRNQYYP